MAKYGIKAESLTAIADAVREKTGSTDKLTPAQMASAISGIEGGDSVNELIEFINGNYSDVVDEKTVKLSSSAFASSPFLTSYTGKCVASLGTGCFLRCTTVTRVDFYTDFKINYTEHNITTNTFYGCTALTTLILRGERVIALAATSIFTNTPIASGTGYIYVPSALVEDYKAATNWSTYADQIRAIEDWPDICGET